MSGGTAARASLDRSLSATSTAQQSSSVVDAASQTGDSNTEVPAEGISASPSINVPFSSADGTAAATIPAALAETDPEMPVTQAERDGIAQLAEEFVARTEGGSQDSRNSARQRRWTQAQEESDIQMRTRYGGHAWLMRHRDAYRKALGNSPDRPDQGK